METTIEFVPAVVVAGRVAVTFAVDPANEDPIGTWVAYHRVLDEPPLRLLLDLIEPGCRFLDVGAHIGMFSLAAAGLGARVVAVEGSPHNARLLREAAAANGFDDLHVVNAVATDHDGRTPFVPHAAWGHVPLVGDGEGQFATIEVDAVALGSLLPSLGWTTADVVKMDIEGWEPMALAGMSEMLRRADRPPILIESNAPGLSRAGGSVAALLHQLADIGYQLFLVDRARPGHLVRVEPDDPQVEVVADYLAATEVPGRLAGWHVVAGQTLDELTGRLVLAAANENTAQRIHAAEVVAGMGDLLDADPELRSVRAALALDLDPSVREGARGPAADGAKARTVAAEHARDEEPRQHRRPDRMAQLRVLARRELVARHRRSLLGVGWTVVAPLLTSAALWVVLSRVFRAADLGVPYVVYLLSGQALLSVVSNVVASVGQSVLNSEVIRAKVPLSTFLVAGAAAVPAVVGAAVMAVVLAVVQLLTGTGVPATAPLALVLLVISVAGALGTGLLVAAFAVRVPDTIQAVGVALTILNYMTPVFYPLDAVPDPWRRVILANPWTHHLIVFRALAYGGELGPGRSWLVVGGSTIALIAVGWAVFRRSSRWGMVAL
ncbi:MAG TPA: FkbM family methyltransferase [Acidimicrobiales bacterium]|nr:FkbM family methyltransferase [Acidimicrobiales bacterium]